MKIIYTLILFLSLNCKSDKDFSITDNPLKRLIIIDNVSRNQYINFIKSSMDKWEIGLDYKLALFRDTRSNTPKNWVQNSKNGLCEEVELSSIKDLCFANTLTYYMNNPYGMIIAFCLVAASEESGEIENTTLVINSNLLYDPLLTDTDRINIIAHEIGHCLGLAHINDYDNIMYPVLIPKKIDYNFHQKIFLKKGYLENIWDRESEFYFSKTSKNGNRVKHPSLPEFYIKVDNYP
jgi:hypothetical protein